VSAETYQSACCISATRNGLTAKFHLTLATILSVTNRSTVSASTKYLNLSNFKLSIYKLDLIKKNSGFGF